MKIIFSLKISVIIGEKRCFFTRYFGIIREKLPFSSRIIWQFALWDNFFLGNTGADAFTAQRS